MTTRRLAIKSGAAPPHPTSTSRIGEAARGWATHAHVRGLASAAMVHGYTIAFWWAAAIFAVGLLVALLVLPEKIKSGAPAGEVALATE